jgi:cyclic-di-AMP phosphodiesterase PgpH
MSQVAKEKRPRSGASQVKKKGSRGRGARFLRRARERWHRLLAVDSFWVVFFLVLATWALMPRVGWLPNDVEVGAIATRDFVAPRDALVLDQESTHEKRQRALQDVLPVFDFDPGAAQRLAQQLERAFSLGRETLEAAEAAREEIDPELLRVRLEEASNLRLSTEQVRLFLRRGFSGDIQERLAVAAEQPLERGVVSDKAALSEHRAHGIHLRNLQTGQEKRQVDFDHYLEYPGDLQDLMAAELRTWGDVPASQRAVLLELMLTNVNPNLHLNQSETLRRQEAAQAAVEETFIRVRKGQVIVRKGDQIEPKEAQLIERLRADAGATSRLLPALGTFLLLALLALVLWLGVRKERVTQASRPAVLGEVLLILLASVLGTRLAYLLASGLAQLVEAHPFDAVGPYLFAIPFAALALVAVLLYGRGVALLVALVFSLLTPVIVDEANWTLVLYAVAGSMAAILTVDHYQFKQRSVMVRAGGVVAMVNVVTVLMLAALAGGAEGSGGELLLQVGCAVAGGVLVSAVASFLVPVLESVFSVTTGIKLVELANTNLPLLRRLAFEAPGTFQHSLMVANLSKAGCDAIEADSVLAYTGALYHDIGKIFRPDYYVENQRPGLNRHDKLLPSMSALILISHVKEGLELAREHHLPEPIQDAIAEHHGTRLITYFYSRAKEMHGAEGGVAEEKFRYPGPKPHSKVMGVLMLADGVEAASRSLEDPTPTKLRAVVKAIVEDCLRDGQLDETDLTLGDLNRVSEAFLRVLSHIHHRRLDYPGFDFEGRQRGARPSDSDEVVVAQPAAPGVAAVAGGPAPLPEPERIDGPAASKPVEETAARRA